MNKPELLVPAGNLDKLKIGLQYGADAFYLGMPSFSMRSRINNFTEESLFEGVDLIRKAGKTFYLTMNIYPRGNKVDAFVKHIKYVREKIKPDAIILADQAINLGANSFIVLYNNASGSAGSKTIDLEGLTSGCSSDFFASETGGGVNSFNCALGCSTTDLGTLS